MITAVIKQGENTLVTGFPVSNYELSAQLNSIGIMTRAADIPIFGTKSIEVKLAADEEIGGAILKRMSDSDTLSGLNIACGLIAKCAPYGYGEFLDMLEPKPDGRYEFYRRFETVPPSAEPGMKGIIEEVRRYSTTMENYRRVCEAEEQDFDEREDDEGWDR